MNPPVATVALSSASAPRARRLGRAWQVLRWLSGLVLALWMVLVLAWLALHWIILPHIDEWRAPLEKQASAALGVPVRIGSIQVRSSGWVPAFELRELRLLDAQGRDALRLARVSAALSPRSLLALQPRFAQLLIEDAQLEMRRDATGHVWVAGLDLGSSHDADSRRAADWLLEQQELVIRRGTLRWTDELRGAPPLQLSGVELLLRNGLRSHALRLDATPPPDWGARFSLQGQFSRPLLAQRADLQQWSGSLHADLPRADLAQLRRHVALPFELSEGDGALRAWLELDHGLPRQATVDLALRAVSLRLGAALQPLALEQVQGRIEASRDAQGLSLQVSNFSLRTGDGAVWPRSNLKLNLRQVQDLKRLDAPAQPVTSGELVADRLDLGLLAATTQRLPLGQALRGLLTRLAPQGTVSDLRARWDGALDAPAKYDLTARVAGLSLASQAALPPPGTAGPAIGRPGLRQGDIELQANERGGQARLAINKGALAFPGVFEQPEVALDQLSAQVQWQFKPSPGAADPAVEVQVRQARFANADAQGEFEATWRTGNGSGVAQRGGRYPGVLDLHGRLTRGRATAVAQYLPLALAASARDYVRRAVQAGQVTAASFKVKGDLWDFPFHQSREGEFRINVKAQDVQLAYVPSEPGWASPWPAFAKVSGELDFDRNSLQWRQASGRLWGSELREVSGAIRQLDAEQPVLSVEGLVRGPLGDMLRYVDSTPLAPWMGQALQLTRASGNADLRLALNIPLQRTEATRVTGSLQLANNDLRLRPDLPALVAARGRVDFSEKSFSLQAASARLAGGETSFEGGLGGDGALRLQLQGQASAEGLRRTPELGALARAAALLRGQAAYKLNLSFAHKGAPEFTLTSNLVGMEIDLPAPFRKAAEAPLPLRLQGSNLVDATRGPGAARDQLQFELGPLQAQYVRDVSAPEAKVLRGGIALQDNLPTPASGVHANLNLGLLEVDEWRAALERLGRSGLAGGAAEEPNPYLPQTATVRSSELVTGNRRINRVVAHLSQQAATDATTWRAQVTADQLAGSLEYRQPRDAQQPGRVMARLSRLSLPPADAAGVEELLAQAPASVPALDIVVEDFELRGRKLGRLEIEAQNRAGAQRGSAREWQLGKLKLSTPEAQLSAKGQWQAAGRGSAERRMALDFTLDLADSGSFAERLGAGRALRGGKGQMNGNLSWAGSPLALDYPSLQGQLNLSLQAGQFLRAEPGVARLLGVLSLQALPRRLLLDFRDVFQEGFAFDSVNADVKVSEGVASTRNLRMRGVQALVLMDGSADLQRETQDLRVLVVPEINAGGASLAYAAVNPALGLGTFLAQLVLRRPLMLAGTREFHVAGPWAAPQVNRIERNADSPAPNLDAAEPASSNATPNPAPKPNPAAPKEPAG